MSGAEALLLEPLLGLVGESSKGLFKFLKKIRNAPKELSELRDEVGQLHDVLKAVKDAGKHESIPPSLAPALDNANEILEEVNKLLAYELTHPGDDEKVNRMAWARHSKQVKKLVEDVRKLTPQFTVLLDIATLIVVEKIAETQPLRFEALTKKLDNQDEKFDDHSMRTQDALAQPQQQTLVLHDTTKNIPAIVGVQRAAVGDALEQMKKITEQSIQTQSQHYEQSIQRFDRLEQLMVKTSERPRQRNVLMITDRNSDSTSIHKNRTTTIRPNNWCPKGCRCACHKSYQLNTSLATVNWTGSIQAQFSGPSWLRPTCTHPKCKRNLPRPVGIQYTLPQWLAGKMFAAWYRSTPLSGPELLLKVARVHQSKAYYYAEKGNLEGLQELYSDSRALINDMNPTDGGSAFDIAVQSRQFDIAAFLQRHGANVEQQDFTGFRARYNAIKIFILDKRYGVSNTIGEIFDMEDLLEDADFTLLHKIVCGLSSLDLEEVLEDHPQLINTRDSNGWTPLAWAVWLDDLDIVKVLLEHGADIASTDDSGDNPFHRLSGCESLPILQFLLESEHSLHLRNLINQTNKYGNAPWHQLRDGDVLSMHIRHGCDLTIRSEGCRTALHLAIKDDRDAGLAEALMVPEISRIDLAAKNSFGETAYDDYDINYYTYYEKASRDGRAKWALLEYAVSLKYGGDGTTKHDRDDFISAFGLDPEVTEWAGPIYKEDDRSVEEVSSDKKEGEGEGEGDDEEEDEDEDEDEDDELYEDAQDQLEPDIDQESTNTSPAP